MWDGDDRSGVHTLVSPLVPPGPLTTYGQTTLTELVSSVSCKCNMRHFLLVQWATYKLFLVDETAKC